MSQIPEFSTTFSKQLSAYLHKDLPDEAEDPFFGLKDKLYDLESQKISAQKQITDLEDQLASLKFELQGQLKLNNENKNRRQIKSDSVFELENSKSRHSRLEQVTELATDMQVQFDSSFNQGNQDSESLNVEAPSTELSNNYNKINKESASVNQKEESDVDHFAKSIDEYLYNTHEDINPINSKVFGSTIQIEETTNPEDSIISMASPSPKRSGQKTVRIAKESIGIEASPMTKSYGTMTSTLDPPNILYQTNNLNYNKTSNISTSTDYTDARTNKKKKPKDSKPLKDFVDEQTQIEFKTPVKNAKSAADKPPFLTGTTPTTYSINAILQQKRNQSKFSPAKVPETLTSLSRKNYNIDVKHPKEENVLRRVINSLENERLLLVRYSRDVTMMKLRIFKPGKLAKASIEHLYSEFSMDSAPNNQKLLELKSRIRRVTVQPAMERIIQKEFDYFFQVIYIYLGIC
eukprot:NODE_96_length_21330_cov_0.419858.p4 type:complete len:463 gc:universal NODE_96_length_21330_cov_0.419858:12758-14146(+)